MYTGSGGKYYMLGTLLNSLKFVYQMNIIGQGKYKRSKD